MPVRRKSEASCWLCGCSICVGDHYEILECVKVRPYLGEKVVRLMLCQECFGNGGKDLVERICEAKEEPPWTEADRRLWSYRAND